MNSQSKSVKYEYIETSDSTNSDAQIKELEAQLITQAEAGYLPTDVTGNDDVQFIEYSYFPQTEAVLKDPEAPLNLELLSSESLADFKTQIAEQQELGNDLIAVSYYGGAWNSYFGEATDEISYTSSDKPEKLMELIDQKFQDSFYIKNVEYGDGTWFATFDKSDGDSTVVEEKNFDKLTGQIETNINAGLDLMSLEYGDKTWVATLGDHSGASSYFTSKDLGVFQEEVAAQQEQGYSLVDVEYVGEAWYGVFNETLGSTEAANDVPSVDAPTDNYSGFLDSGLLPSGVNSVIIPNFVA
jgi:hypothetical protein